MTERIEGAIEGKGGQGVLFLGTLLGRALQDRYSHITVSPSYTAEMFGGPCHSFVVGTPDGVAAPVPERLDFAVAFPNCTPRLIPRMARPGTWIVSTGTGRVNVDVFVQRGLAGPRRSIGSIALGKRARPNVLLFGAIARTLGIAADRAVEVLAATLPGGAQNEQIKDLREFLTSMGPIDA